jgi:hypothetical protein
VQILLVLSTLTPIYLGSFVSMLISLALPVSLPAVQALQEPILLVASLKQVSKALALPTTFITSRLAYL